MSEVARWKVTLTPEQLPRLREQVAWTMQRQNRRVVELSPAERLGVQARQIVAAAACLVGLGALVSLWLLAPEAAHAHPLLFILGAAFFLAMSVAAILLRQVRARSRRFAGRMIAFTARRTFAGIAGKLPYDVLYSLQGTTLVARVEVLNLTRALELRSVGLALRTPSVLVLYRRRFSQRPLRIIYLAPGFEAALLETLGRAGVACEAIEGPLEGYAEPGPAST